MTKNGARDQDLAMGRARRDMLWNEQFDLALDPETAKKVKSERAPSLATAWFVPCAKITVPLR